MSPVRGYRWTAQSQHIARAHVLMVTTCAVRGRSEKLAVVEHIERAGQAHRQRLVEVGHALRKEVEEDNIPVEEVEEVQQKQAVAVEEPRRLVLHTHM